jgi:NAD-dependent deacetylase
MSLGLSSHLLTALLRAQRVVAFTGAGVSAESGVPTFRSADGIWKRMRPEELASMDGFLRNPALVWEWYAQRKRVIADVQPNPGHHALVRMETLFPEFALITQNIDNLHRRAGSRTVYELHGNIERNYCMQCGLRYSNEQVLCMKRTPSCAECGGNIRPDVVWFGEVLPEEEWEASVRAAESADVFFSIGTSSVVYPAASLPTMAKRCGAYVVEVNPEPTPLTPHADEFLQGASGVVLPFVCDAIEQEQRSET